MKTLVIDNYDSFTFNIVQLFAQVTGDEPMVVRNDALTLGELRALAPDCIVISPGPGSPANDRDLGISKNVILDPPCPVLGVCLGFQGMALLHGSEVVQAKEPWHGRGSWIRHDGSELFRGIPSPFFAIRYHSLCIPELAPDLTGDGLVATASTADGIVMALRHASKPMWGVQFHPESIATEYGFQLVANFCELAGHSESFSGIGWEKPEKPPSDQAPIQTPVRFRQIRGAPSPEAVFVGLFQDRSPSFWLDSSAATGRRSRFSFLGNLSGAGDLEIRYDSKSRSIELIRGSVREAVSGSIFDFLKHALAQERAEASSLPLPFCGGYVGYFGYELKGECGGQYHRPSTLPDAYFLKVSRFIGFDHQSGDCYVVALGQDRDAEDWIERTTEAISRLGPENPEIPIDCAGAPRFHFEQSREQYLDSIGRALDKIHAGESYQVCLTNRLRSRFNGDPLALYRILRRSNPSPFAAFLNAKDFSVLSASPERFLKIEPGGAIESRPIKGTIKRSADPAEDRRLAEILRRSEKDQAENLMIVDLVRNDLGRVARTGSVEVPGLMPVESYPTVHHIVSTVRAQLVTPHQAIDCVRAAFPGGSMTGAPKLRTMEIIDELESSARGVYSGALGYLSLTGAADLSIVIRTMVLRGGELSIGTGGGIVALSDPDGEVLEAELKARALVDAVEQYYRRASRAAQNA